MEILMEFLSVGVDILLILFVVLDLIKTIFIK